MQVFRISLEKWSHRLSASGFGARWNSKGRFVIYTSESRSLACLENVVHRNGEGFNHSYKVMTIEIDKSVKIQELDVKKLDKHWSEFSNTKYCKRIGNEWVDKHESGVLKSAFSFDT